VLSKLDLLPIELSSVLLRLLFNTRIYNRLPQPLLKLKRTYFEPVFIVSPEDGSVAGFVTSL